MTDLETEIEKLRAALKRDDLTAMQRKLLEQGIVELERDLAREERFWERSNRDYTEADEGMGPKGSGW